LVERSSCEHTTLPSVALKSRPEPPPNIEAWIWHRCLSYRWST
jgi:hypothetical protein